MNEGSATPTASSAQYFSRAELKTLLQKSDLQGWKALAWDWGLILLMMTLVALYPNPLLILLAMGVIAGRQLGLAILMHDCAHYSLFASKGLNQRVGRWLCGAPLFIDLDGYRTYHLKHHQTAGSEEDPDFPNYKSYPVSRSSFRRKVVRDLTGVTGFKNLIVILSMSLGFADYTLAYKMGDERPKRTWKAMLVQARRFLLAPLVVHAVGIALLVAIGEFWLYGLWFATYLSLYMLVLRIRNVAEHAALPENASADPRLHTRTTLASWWERLLVAPNYVNYHLEHHLLPAVPGYRLPDMHRIMRERDLIPARSLAKGYADVVRQMVKTAPKTPSEHNDLPTP